MSLLPRALQFRDEALSLPLGAAKVKPVAVKFDPISAFEKGNHGSWIGAFEMVRELKRDLAEAKPSAGAGLIGLAPPSPEKPPFKAGDRVRMRFTRGLVAVGTVVGASSAFPGEWCCDPDAGQKCGAGIFKPDQLELIPSEPKEADGAWIEWGGGSCPIYGEDTAHEVRFRDGWESGRDLDPRGWRWNHVDSGSDIVAYRLLVKQQ